MIWLLGGYIWLYVHRPFEVWPSLGPLQIERGYMLLMLLVWVIYPYKSFSFNRIHLALGAFTLALIGAWLMSPYAGAKGPLDAMDTYFKIIVFYGILVTTVRDEKSFRLLILLFLAVNALYMAHSLREWFAGRYQSRMGVSRMIGVDTTWGDPNAFASTLLFTLPLLVPFWFEVPRRIPRWVIISYALACLFCISRTASRGGFIGMVVFLVVVYISNSRNKLYALLTSLLVGFALGTVALAVGPEDLVTRYMTLVDENVGQRNAHESAESRLVNFHHGLHLWGQSPLFGHGPATFAIASGSGMQAHNLAAQVLSETGLAGAMGLLGLIACFLINWYEARSLVAAEGSGPGHDFTFQVVRALCFSIGLMLLMGLGGHNLFRYNWLWFAAFQAIGLSCLRQRVAAQQAALHYGPLSPQLGWQG